MLTEFTSTEIDLPQLLIKIENGSESLERLDSGAIYYVYYFNPDDCTSCTLNHLFEYERIYEIARQTGDSFYPLFIFSPWEDEITDIIRAIKEMDINHPIYVDVSGELHNIPILSEEICHKFLLLDKHPAIVGDPITNKHIERLLLEYLPEVL